MDRSAISPDGRIIAVFAHSTVAEKYAATIQVCDLTNQQELWSVNGHEQAIHSLTFSPDGRMLVSTSANRTIKFWDPIDDRQWPQCWPH